MASAILTIELSSEAYERLLAHARERGQTPEALSRELIENALPHNENRTDASTQRPPSRSVRDILAATGRLRDLGPALEAKIIPGVSLQEVQEALTRAAGPSLSAIVDSNRGPKD
jgi:hypothetical protein